MFIEYSNYIISLVNIFANNNTKISYIIVSLVCMIEHIIPPIPGDFILVSVGIIANSSNLDIDIVLVFSIIGGIIGFMSMYLVGFKLKKQLLHIKPLKRFISLDNIDNVSVIVDKNSFFILLLNRFIPMIRSCVSLSSGILRINVYKVLILSSISTVLWNSFILMFIKYYNMNTQQILSLISNLNTKILYILIPITIYILYKIGKIKYVR